jgi:ABC-2 type transport system permease protein
MRYIKLWLSLAKNNLIRQTEFKANLFGRLILEFVWIGSQVLFFKAALTFAPNLAGWTEPEIWFFVGSLFLVDGLLMVFFHENQSNFGQMIKLGQFDFYLLYPASSAFLANFRFVNVVSIINVIIAISIVIWASTLSGIDMNFLSWLVWAIYITLGTSLVILFGILICSTSFWTTESANLVWLFHELYRLGFRPEGIYHPWLKRLLMSVFPAAFFISIPVQLSIGKLGGWWFVYPFVVFIILFFLVNSIWRRGVKNFEGAFS